MFFPQQQQSEIAPVDREPSRELVFRRNLTKTSYFLGYASLGALATTMVGMYPTYWGLYVLGSGLGVAAIALCPAEGSEDRSNLWNSLSFLVGLVLPWWGLVSLIKPAHVAGAIAVFFAIVFAIGAIGGQQ